jgi:hypothetical protein
MMPQPNFSASRRPAGIKGIASDACKELSRAWAGDALKACGWIVTTTGKYCAEMASNAALKSDAVARVLLVITIPAETGSSSEVDSSLDKPRSSKTPNSPSATSAKTQPPAFLPSNIINLLNRVCNRPNHPFWPQKIESIYLVINRRPGR